MYIPVRSTHGAAATHPPVCRGSLFGLRPLCGSWGVHTRSFGRPVIALQGHQTGAAIGTFATVFLRPATVIWPLAQSMSNQGGEHQASTRSSHKLC